jgi:hypothetical protein
VTPTYAQLNGADPVAFIMSSNDRRRHMKLGQRAMIGAKVLRIKYATIREAGKQIGVSNSYIAHASVVLEYANDQVDGVISGAIALNDAYRGELPVFRGNCQNQTL